VPTELTPGACESPTEPVRAHVGEWQPASTQQVQSGQGSVPIPIVTPLAGLASTSASLAKWSPLEGAGPAEGVNGAALQVDPDNKAPAQEVTGVADAEEDTDGGNASSHVHLRSLPLDSDFLTPDVAETRTIDVEDPGVGAEQVGARRDTASSAAERIIHVVRGEKGSIGVGFKETKCVHPASGGDELTGVGASCANSGDRDSGRRIRIEMIVPGSTAQSSGENPRCLCVRFPPVPVSTPAWLRAGRRGGETSGFISLEV